MLIDIAPTSIAQTGEPVKYAEAQRLPRRADVARRIWPQDRNEAWSGRRAYMEISWGRIAAVSVLDERGTGAVVPWGANATSKKETRYRVYREGRGVRP